MRIRRNGLYAFILAIAIFFVGCDRYFSNSTTPTPTQPSSSATSDLASISPSIPIASRPPPSEDPTAEASACNDPQTQVELNDCAASQAKAADEKLNQAYQQIRSELKGSDRDDLLIDAQLAWIEFRDKNCMFARSKYEGGSIEPLIYSDCIERVTQQRTEELQTYLKDMAQIHSRSNLYSRSLSSPSSSLRQSAMVQTNLS